MLSSWHGNDGAPPAEEPSSSVDPPAASAAQPAPALRQPPWLGSAEAHEGAAPQGSSLIMLRLPLLFPASPSLDLWSGTAAATTSTTGTASTANSHDAETPTAAPRPDGTHTNALRIRQPCITDKPMQGVAQQTPHTTTTTTTTLVVESHDTHRLPGGTAASSGCPPPVPSHLGYEALDLQRAAVLREVLRGISAVGSAAEGGRAPHAPCAGEALPGAPPHLAAHPASVWGGGGGDTLPQDPGAQACFWALSSLMPMADSLGTAAASAAVLQPLTAVLDASEFPAGSANCSGGSGSSILSNPAIACQLEGFLQRCIQRGTGGPAPLSALLRLGFASGDTAAVLRVAEGLLLLGGGGTDPPAPPGSHAEAAAPLLQAARRLAAARPFLDVDAGVAGAGGGAPHLQGAAAAAAAAGDTATTWLLRLTEALEGVAVVGPPAHGGGGGGGGGANPLPPLLLGVCGRSVLRIQRGGEGEALRTDGLPEGFRLRSICVVPPAAGACPPPAPAVYVSASCDVEEAAAGGAADGSASSWRIFAAGAACWWQGSGAAGDGGGSPPVVSLREVPWPEGVERCPAERTSVKVVAGEGGALALAVGRRVPTQNGSGAALGGAAAAAQLREQIEGFDSIVDMLASRQVPFDMAVEDVTRQLEEQRSGASGGGGGAAAAPPPAATTLTPHVAAALRAAAAARAAAAGTPGTLPPPTPPQPSLTLHTLTQCLGAVAHTARLGLPPPSSPPATGTSSFAFGAGGASADASRALRAQPPHGAAVSPSTPLSFEAWVRADAPSGSLFFIGSNAAHFHATLGSHGGVPHLAAGWWGSGGGRETGAGRLLCTAPPASTARPGWAHVAVVFDPARTHGEALMFYLNGSRLQPFAASAELAPVEDMGFMMQSLSRHPSDYAQGGGSAAPRVVGNTVLLGGGLHGAMREARLWGHARTPEELGYGMRVALPLCPAPRHVGLVAHWALSEGVGMRLFDSGPHAMHLFPVQPLQPGRWESSSACPPPALSHAGGGGGVHSAQPCSERPPIASGFERASLHVADGRVAVVQPLEGAVRQVVSEYDAATGRLVAERCSEGVAEGPLAWCGGVRWHVCNRTARASCQGASRMLLQKAVLLQPPHADTPAAAGWVAVRVLALLGLLGHSPSSSSSSSSAWGGGSHHPAALRLAAAFRLLQAARQPHDVYAALLVLVGAARELPSPGARFPHSSVVLPEALRCGLLPALLEVRRAGGAAGGLPIAALATDALQLCISLVHATQEGRSAALVSSVFAGDALAGDLALHCHTPHAASLVLACLARQPEGRGTRAYLREVLSCVADHAACDMQEAAGATPAPAPPTPAATRHRFRGEAAAALLQHAAALQIAVAAQAGRAQGSFFADWAHPTLQACSAALRSAAASLSRAADAPPVLDALRRGFVGVLLPQLLPLLRLSGHTPSPAPGLEPLLSELRAALRGVAERLGVLGAAGHEAFRAGASQVPSIVSQSHSSAHPYRLDSASLVRFEGASSFTITFDAQSRLEGRDELVVLWANPADGQTQTRVLKDGPLSQAKVVVDAPSALVFTRGSLRAAPTFSLSAARSTGPSDMQRGRWGYAFTATASARCWEFRLGWLHDLLAGAACASAAAAQALLCNAAAPQPPHADAEAPPALLAGGLRPPEAAQPPPLPDTAWHAFATQHPLAAGQQQHHPLLRTALAAALHLSGTAAPPALWPPSAAAALSQARERLQGCTSTATATALTRADFLLRHIAPPHDTPHPTLPGAISEVVQFAFGSTSLEATFASLRRQSRAAESRLEGLAVLVGLQHEAEAWCRGASPLGGAFLLQAAAGALTASFRTHAYSHSIERSGGTLAAVRAQVVGLVTSLLRLAAAPPPGAAAPLRCIALSCLAMAWPMSDARMLASSPEVLRLLEPAALCSQQHGEAHPSFPDLSRMPHGQHVSDTLAKAEDVLGWHLSVEGCTAHVRHDGRSLTHHFLWNASDARKGKNIVCAAKPWCIQSAPRGAVFYFEACFVECPHRLPKGLGVGLCCPKSPFLRQALYKSNGNICSTAPIPSALPRFRLGDRVGCGVACVAAPEGGVGGGGGSAPLLFYTRNGVFLGFVWALPAQLRAAVPAAGAKYGCKVKFHLCPGSWSFDLSQLRHHLGPDTATTATAAAAATTAPPPHPACGGAEAKASESAEALAAQQGRDILRCWASRSAGSAEAEPLFTACIAAARRHTAACMQAEVSDPSGAELLPEAAAGPSVWVQRHLVMLLASLRCAAARGGGAGVLRCAGAMAGCGWGPLLHTAATRAIDTPHLSSRAAEAALEIYRTVAEAGAPPDHPLLCGGPRYSCHAAALPIRAACAAAAASASPDGGGADGGVEAAASALGRVLGEHQHGEAHCCGTAGAEPQHCSLVDVLFRGAAEGVLHLGGDDDAAAQQQPDEGGEDTSPPPPPPPPRHGVGAMRRQRGGFAMVCVRLLRILSNLHGWRSDVDQRAASSLLACPDTPQDLLADLCGGGAAAVSASTALAVLGGATPPVARGVRAVTRPPYGIPQACTVTGTAEGGTTTVALDSGGEAEVGRDTVIPWDRPDRPLCPAASAEALRLCGRLASALPAFAEAGVALGIERGGGGTPHPTDPPPRRRQNSSSSSSGAPAEDAATGTEVESDGAVPDDTEASRGVPAWASDNAGPAGWSGWGWPAAGGGGGGGGGAAAAATLPLASVAGSLLHASLAAVSEVVRIARTAGASRRMGDDQQHAPTPLPRDALEGCAASLSENLAQLPLRAPGVLPQLAAQRDACLSLLREGGWRTAPAAARPKHPARAAAGVAASSGLLLATSRAALPIAYGEAGPDDTYPSFEDQDPQDHGMEDDAAPDLSVVGTNPSVQRQRAGLAGTPSATSPGIGSGGSRASRASPLLGSGSEGLPPPPLSPQPFHPPAAGGGSEAGDTLATGGAGGSPVGTPDTPGPRDDPTGLEPLLGMGAAATPSPPSPPGVSQVGPLGGAPQGGGVGRAVPASLGSSERGSVEPLLPPYREEMTCDDSPQHILSGAWGDAAVGHATAGQESWWVIPSIVHSTFQGWGEASFGGQQDDEDDDATRDESEDGGDGGGDAWDTHRAYGGRPRRRRRHPGNPLGQPLHGVWGCALLWQGALCVAEARCALVRITALLHSQQATAGVGQGVAGEEEAEAEAGVLRPCGLTALLSMLDAPALADVGAEQDGMQADVSCIVALQASLGAGALACEAAHRLSLTGGGGGGVHRGGSVYTTPEFDLAAKLLEVLAAAHPDALLTGAVVHEMVAAVHLHAVPARRRRLLLCLVSLLRAALRRPSITPNCNWSDFSAIHHTCEKSMVLLAGAAHASVIPRGPAESVPCVSAELLYLMRKLLRRGGRRFDDVVVPGSSAGCGGWGVGSLVERLDASSGRWLQGVVLAVSQRRLYLTFQALPAVQDLWVSKGSQALRLFTPRLPNPCTASSISRTSLQDFGRHNDVSTVLHGQVQPSESLRLVPLVVSTPSGPDELPRAACEDLCTLMSSCSKGDVPRWYECTAASGEMYTLIVDRMIAVNMATGIISPIEPVGVAVEVRKIPFALYEALEHLAACLAEGSPIPLVWGDTATVDTDRWATLSSCGAVDALDAGRRHRIEAAYHDGPPQEHPDDLMPLSAEAWCRTVALFDSGNPHEDDPRYSQVIDTLNYAVFLPVLPCLNLETPPGESDIAAAVNRIKPLLCKKVTLFVLKHVLAPKAAGQHTVQLRLDRHASKRPGAGLRDSILGQLQAALEGHPPSLLSGSGAPFRVSFVGEAGIDQGGIYRDALAALAAELMNDGALLVPRPEGHYVNSVLTSPLHQALMRCLGKIMATCIRCNDIVALDLHPNIWKVLAGEETQPEELDPSFFAGLRYITDAEGADTLEQTFSVPVAGGEIELIPGGKSVPVTGDNWREYVRLAREAKKQEGSRQLEQIREGILEVLPRTALTVLTALELEELVCGQRHISVATLQEHASYGRRLIRSNVAENLWKTLNGFCQQDLQAFLRFVTGRPRVPVGKEAAITIDCIDSPIDGLPESHTCTSLLCLPPYTTPEQMRRQLVYAVRNCDTTDIV